MAGNGKLPSLIQVVPDGVDATSLAVGPQGVALATDGGWSEDRASFGDDPLLGPEADVY